MIKQGSKIYNIVGSTQVILF